MPDESQAVPIDELGAPERRDLAREMIGHHLRMSVPDAAVFGRVLRDQVQRVGKQDTELLVDPGAGVVDGAPDRALVAAEVAGLDTSMDRLLADYSAHRAVIAVVGAGASYPKQALTHDLLSEVVRQVNPDRAAYEAEKVRLKAIHKIPPEDFELSLMALSTSPKAAADVRAALADHHRRRFPTLLQYELLAHLLKHRFLDAIVSFNFDEMLDQSISDELSDDEYVRVVSERDCEGLRYARGSLRQRPLYIKPHGTASEPSSLRFSREAYFHLPETIRGLLGQVIGYDDALVLSVGSGLRDLDLLNLLAQPRRLRIVDLSPIPAPEPVRIELRPDPHEESGDRHVHYLATPRAQANEEADRIGPPSDEEDRERSLLIGKELLSLCDEIRDLTAGPIGTRDPALSLAAFRSTIRHEAVTAILAEPAEPLSSARHTSPPGQEDFVRYLTDRMTLEMAFAAVRGRGLVSISSLLAERAGRYYELLQRQPGWEETWATACSRGGLRASLVSPETFVLRRWFDMGPGRVVGESSLPEDEERIYQIDTARLAQWVVSSLQSLRVEPDESPAEARVRTVDYLTQVLGRLNRGSEVELHAFSDRVCSKVYDDPVVLPTLSAFSINTHDLFYGQAGPGSHRTAFDQLAMVSETGEWLTEDSPHVNQIREACRDGHLRILLLVAFRNEQERLESMFGEGLRVTQLPWFRHNRHMTVTLRGGRPIGAIYFARRLRSLSITPVRLGPADALEVWNAFHFLYLSSIGRTFPDASQERDLSLSFDELFTARDATLSSPLIERLRAIADADGRSLDEVVAGLLDHPDGADRGGG